MDYRKGLAGRYAVMVKDARRRPAGKSHVELVRGSRIAVTVNRF